MTINRLGSLLLSYRLSILVGVHALVFALCYFIATLLRYDFVIPSDGEHLLWATIGWVVAAKLACSYVFGSFHGWMRYVTFHDLVVLLRATAACTLMIVLIDYFIISKYTIPRSILVLDFLLTVLCVGGLRSIGRLSREQLLPVLQMKFLKNHGSRGALIVGATPRGVQIAGQVHARHELNTRIVGFLDVDLQLHGRRLMGIAVFGHPRDVAEHARASGAQDVLVLSGSLGGKDLRLLVDRCREAKLNLKVLPSVDEFVSGRCGGANSLRLRDVDINDLLRREPVTLDDSSLFQFIQNRTIMVTGAGGSIGSEICRQLLAFKPHTIVLVERAENNLFNIDRELSAICINTRIVPCIADVTDSARMRQVFETTRPDVVFHAAAHKHVPMMERNPGEAIKNNTLGTKLVADLAHEYGLQSFVMISTDKAVNPTSVMGLSKQLAERYVYALSQTSTTRFMAVRFGNVLGSVGSVVPVFQQQIRNGEPITVTHPEMRRYFMTIPEAAQLVAQAGAMGKGGEIFVLEMGEPVKIVDLAHDLIRLSGLSPDDVEIVFSGIRPGEKLYEELYFDEEQTLPTPHPKLRVAYHRPYTVDEVMHLYADLEMIAHDDDPGHILSRLRELVPEYLGGSDASAVPCPGIPSAEPANSFVSGAVAAPLK